SARAATCAPPPGSRPATSPRSSVAPPTTGRRSTAFECCRGRRGRRPPAPSPTAGLAGRDLAADLAVQVLGGVDVHVQLVLREEALQLRGELRRAGEAASALRRGAAERDEDVAGLAGRADVDVRGGGGAGQSAVGELPLQ